MSLNKGNLYLIPCPIGETPPLEVLPLLVKKAIEDIDHFVVENERSARRFIKSLVPRKSQGDLHFRLINKFTDESEIPKMIEPCLMGQHVGVLSEAGCPGVADPGALVVAQAHSRGVKVIPLVGPSSILLALMASGLNGQNFAFNGYLPIDKRERRKEIKRFERLSAELQQSQLFIETPYRNNQLLESLLSTLQGQTHLCIAADITMDSEFIETHTVDEWKKIKVDLNKRPTLFLFQK